MILTVLKALGAAGLLTKLLVAAGLIAAMLAAYGVWHHKVYQSGVTIRSPRSRATMLDL